MPPSHIRVAWVCLKLWSVIHGSANPARWQARRKSLARAA